MRTTPARCPAAPPAAHAVLSLAAPRVVPSTCRGNLAAQPRKIEQGNRAFVAGRMGVNMASPDVAAEERTS